MSSTHKKLEGKTALITGGASGIGLAIAEKFISEGASVVLADLNSELLATAEKKFGNVCATIKTDVTNEAEVKNAVTLAVDRFDSLDIAVNSAGLGSYGVITEMEEGQWDTIVNVCLKGVFFSMKHEGIQMTKQGSGVIINISSLNSIQPGEGSGAYCASKAGVNMLTKVGAMEMGPSKVRVCGIAPGLVFTPITEPIRSMPALYEAYLENIPLGREGTTDDIANATLFMASDDASWISGETLFIDGGSQTKRYPEFTKIFSEMG